MTESAFSIEESQWICQVFGYFLRTSAYETDLL